MIRSAEGTAREAKIAELKRLITAGTYETMEKLEEAVDAFLWRDENQLDQASGELNDAVGESNEHARESNTELRRNHPKAAEEVSCRVASSGQLQPSAVAHAKRAPHSSLVFSATGHARTGRTRARRPAAFVRGG